jgi:formate hydrogenlyase subunit 3/multisubunit Na+/H+ antiporter MnhD subunit
MPSPIPSLILAMLALPWISALSMRPLARLSPGLAALLGPASLAGCLLISGLLWRHVQGVPIQLGFGAPGSLFELRLQVDTLALLLATITLGLMLAFWPRGEDHPDPARRNAVLLLLAGGFMGLAWAGDMTMAWLFGELCALSLCALLVLTGTLRSLVALLAFVRWSTLGSVLALAGLGLLLATTDSTLPFAAAEPPGELASGAWPALGLGLLVLGFGAKAMLFPLNAWAGPLSRAAPALALVLISAVLPTLILISLARLQLSGVGTDAAGTSLLLLGMLTTCFASYGLWRATEFPTFVVQFGLANAGLAAVAFAVPGPAGLFPGLALLLHLLLMQTALYALTGCWRGRITDLTGIAWRTPLIGGALILLAASFIGVPPLPGFWIRLMLVLSLAEHSGSGELAVLLVVVLVTIAQAVAWLRLLRVLYARARPLGMTESEKIAIPRADGRVELLIPRGLDRVLVFCLALMLILGALMIAPVTESLNHLVLQTATQP